MKPEYTKLLGEILTKIATTDQIRPSKVPDIDLYMDQVTHFMDEHLKESKRYDDDKILTKTMINNYAKNKLLPPPTKKRYSREHMYVLLFIYYFKGFLSLADIQSILGPITDRFFEGEEGFNIKDIYEEIYSLSEEQVSKSAREIMNSFHTASHSFEDCPEEDRDFLQMFSFICLLGFDIYLKKEVIEKMIDAFSQNIPPKK